MTLSWDRTCEHDADVRDMVRRMARGGLADASLNEHIAACTSCIETVAVAEWMHELASVPVAHGPLPNPAYLWWKAQLLRRWDAEQRASAPVEVGEQVQVGLGLVALSGLLVWLWRNLPDLTSSPALATTTIPLVVVMTVSGALLAAMAALMVRNLIRREE